MTKLLITGASGRMGETLIEAGQDNINSEVSATHDIGQDLDSTFEALMPPLILPHTISPRKF